MTRVIRSYENVADFSLLRQTVTDWLLLDLKNLLLSELIDLISELDIVIYSDFLYLAFDHLLTTSSMSQCLYKNESLKVVNSINIFSQQQFQSMIVNYFDELWNIFENFRRNRDRKVIVIRAWNFQIENMKIKISNHNKKKYEINKVLRIVKVEVFVAQTQYNELFKIQRVRENKEKQRKKKDRYIIRIREVFQYRWKISFWF